MDKNYLKAIALAITLEQPLRVSNITKGASVSISLALPLLARFLDTGSGELV